MKTLLLAAALLAGCGPVDFETQVKRCRAEVTGNVNASIGYKACMVAHGWPVGPDGWPMPRGGWPAPR